MAEILRVKLRWSGFVGGPGYSVFHFRDFEATGNMDQAIATGSVSKVDQFIVNIKGYLPPAVKLRTEADVEVIESTNGQLQTVFTTSPAAEAGGTASSTAGWSAAAGANISWRTAGIRNGRRVRGRTFLVPLSSEAYQNDGTLATAAHSLFQGAATTLASQTGAGDLGVYARPSGPGATDGVFHLVTSAFVPDRTAVLRSRRD